MLVVVVVILAVVVFLVVLVVAYGDAKDDGSRSDGGEMSGEPVRMKRHFLDYLKDENENISKFIGGIM